MNQFFEKYPWLKSVGCEILVLALVLSICLPLMGMRSAEPDNPILTAEPQEITVLQAGKAPGGAGSGDGVQTSGKKVRACHIFQVFPVKDAAAARSRVQQHKVCAAALRRFAAVRGCERFYNRSARALSQTAYIFLALMSVQLRHIYHRIVQ